MQTDIGGQVYERRIRGQVLKSGINTFMGLNAIHRFGLSIPLLIPGMGLILAKEIVFIFLRYSDDRYN